MATSIFIYKKPHLKVPYRAESLLPKCEHIGVRRIVQYGGIRVHLLVTSVKGALARNAAR
jgi:hypothetical protein